jgi:hypothetical protein
MSNRFAGLAKRTGNDVKVEDFIQAGAERQSGSADAVNIAPDSFATRKPKEKKQVQKVLVSFPIRDAQQLGELANLPTKCTQSDIVSAAVRAFAVLTVEQQIEWIRKVKI